MLLHEWPLILFTLLAQTAVGIVFVGEIIIPSLSGAYIQKVRKQTIIAFVLFALAAILSLAHTGSPLHAFYTMCNIGSSWLSREIFMVSLAGLALFGLTIVRFKSLLANKEKALAWTFVVLGFVLTYTMTQVYNIPAVKNWNGCGGILSFLATPFLMGATWYAFVIYCPKFLESEANTTGCVNVLSIALIGLVFAACSLPLTLANMGASHIPQLPVESLPTFAKWLSFRMLSTGFGVLLLTLYLARVAAKLKVCSYMLITAVILIFAGELFGRIIFYSQYTRIGI